MSSSVSFMEDQPVTLQAARDRAKAAFVVHLVALATGVPPKEIMQEGRSRAQAARARGLAVYLIHVGFSVPLMRVAAAFGRDRTTVGQAVRRVEDWREDPAFDLALAQLEACLQATPLGVSAEALSGGTGA